MKINRRSWLIPWAGLIALFVGLIRQSVSYGITRLAIVVVGLLILIGLLYLIWRQRLIRLGLLAIIVSSSGFLLLPGNPTAGQALQPQYLSMLRSYEGSPYIRGGENHFGIDSSGLVRAGLIQANLHAGFQQMNPALIRQGLEMWWFDAAADALLHEYRHYTQRQLIATSINELDHSQIEPGDLAATPDGAHISAYLGDRQWIEVEPNLQKVVIVSVPTHHPWFEQPVQILRWQQFLP